MNLQKLKEAEAFFLSQYPEGFSHPDMIAIGKKHKMDQMIAYAQEHFKPESFNKNFNQVIEISEHVVKQVGRASMVSRFEKPKFRDMVNTLSPHEREDLVFGLECLLHGDQEQGFELTVSLLKTYKLAKWSLITIIPNYYRPNEEVFVKPTTAKGVIKYFELDCLEYKPTPSWDFYRRYRDAILEMKSHVTSDLSPSNAAFCGFLMMSI